MYEERHLMATAPTTPRTETAEAPASLVAQLLARIDLLEHRERERAEASHRPTLVIDASYEAWKADVARPAAVRTQEVADKKYGTGGRRFKVRLDARADDGKPGPNVSEHPELWISANSDLEAGARYLEICGIRKHDYRIVAEPVAAMVA